MESSLLTDKTLDILETVASLGSASMPQVQAQCGLSMTTTHRIMHALMRRGYLIRIGRGDFRLGSVIQALAARMSDRDTLSAVARPHLLHLSRKTRSHAHLGIWEDAMVTYLVKQRFGKSQIHSAEGMQLEAYCSALGKVLLAGLPDRDLDRYLSDGTFVALTSNTIVDPKLIREEIACVRDRGWSMDDEEIAVNLRCVAVPIKDRLGMVIAAISVSAVGSGQRPDDPSPFIPLLSEAAEHIGKTVHPDAQALY